MSWQTVTVIGMCFISCWAFVGLLALASHHSHKEKEFVTQLEVSRMQYEVATGRKYNGGT